MYAWIWRKLPFGRLGKLAGSLLLVTAAVATLWYVVFPWAEPLLPFDDVQVGTTSGDQGPAEQDPNAPGATVEDPSDGPALPYSTQSNNPEPSPTRTRTR